MGDRVLSTASLPLIDVAAIMHADSVDFSSAEAKAVIQQLGEACSTIGFFYVTNHGVEASAREAMNAAGRFFQLPVEEVDDCHHSLPLIVNLRTLRLGTELRHRGVQKEKISNVNSPAFRGYITLGIENTKGIPDMREQIEFGVESTATHLKSGKWPENAELFERLRGPNQWPEEGTCPGFRHAMEGFMLAMERLSRQLTKALAASLQLESDSFDFLFTEPNVQMKICRYPAQQSQNGFGVGPHTDSGFLSLLCQDQTGGLQIQTQTEAGYSEWCEVKPVDDAVVVNLGEMLQKISKGKYIATMHRVMCKPREESGPSGDSSSGAAARLSIPYFWNPNLDCDISKLDALQESQAGDSSCTRENAFERKDNVLLSNYGMNAFKSLARSHPRVMDRHHPDLKVLPDGRVVRVPL